MSSTETPRKLDPRLNAYRPDLAASNLKGKVEAANFVEGARYQVNRPLVPMREQPGPASPIVNEILFGEILWVYDTKDGWAWCQLDRDDYVGYVPLSVLTERIEVATHRVSALGTFVYRQANIKSEPLMHLGLNARLSIVGADGKMSALAGGGFIVNRHISEISKYARDFVELAERMIGVPYLWGGRTRIGIDCSGLVQLTMEAAGRECPRDSDMQRNLVGVDVSPGTDWNGLLRGDLVFWPGHVGIMADGVMLVHANAHHMAVVTEPLVTAIARIERTGSKVLCVRRPAVLVT